MAFHRGLFAVFWIGCSSVSAQAQQLGGGGGQPEVSIMRIVAALVVCLAAALGLILYLKGKNGTSFSRLSHRWLNASFAASRRVEVVEARKVSPFADVCLIRCDETEYLLICGPSGQTLLKQSPCHTASFKEPADVA